VSSGTVVHAEEFSLLVGCWIAVGTQNGDAFVRPPMATSECRVWGPRGGFCVREGMTAGIHGFVLPLLS